MRLGRPWPRPPACSGPVRRQGVPVRGRRCDTSPVATHDQRPAATRGGPARKRSRGGPAHERPVRERLGHERPGTVLHGPPISVRCECGARRDLRYGEVWECEDCGRRWDTAQIPREQYARIRSIQLRFRALPVALGLVVACVAAFFVATGNTFSLFILVPCALIAWMTLLRPAHRRRYRAAIAHLPQWTLHADRPSAGDRTS
jgi:hypothetical protein